MNKNTKVIISLSEHDYAVIMASMATLRENVQAEIVQLFINGNDNTEDIVALTEMSNEIADTFNSIKRKVKSMSFD